MTLKKQQVQVLRTVQFRSREERWNHKTLCHLRTLGLVASENHQSGAVYRWTITPAGTAFLEAL